MAGEGTLPGGVDVEGAHAWAARVWAANPWTRRVPVGLAAVRVGVEQVVDPEGRGVALTADADVWALLARTGGHPTDVFGELDHGRFRPLTIVQRGEVVAL